MTISYRNGFRDRLAFAAYHLPRNPLVILITAAIFLYLTFEGVPPAGRPMVIRVIAFGLYEIMLLLFLVAFYTIMVILAMISTKNKPLYCQRSLTVGDDAFVTESEYGRSETKWSVVQKLARTRSHIFMYLSQENAVVIPRRAFESADQWDRFYEICRRNRSQAG